MKKVKYFIIGLSIMGIGFIMGGCADNVKAESGSSIYTFSKDGETGNVESYTMVDGLTGVNYVVIKYWDNRDSGVSITTTPRLNADGTLYVTK